VKRNKRCGRKDFIVEEKNKQYPIFLKYFNIKLKMSVSFEFVVSQYLQTTKPAEIGPVEYRKKITVIALAKQYSVMEWIELAVGEKLFQSMGSINTEERLNDMQIVFKRWNYFI